MNVSIQNSRILTLVNPFQDFPTQVDCGLQQKKGRKEKKTSQHRERRTPYSYSATGFAGGIPHPPYSTALNQRTSHSLTLLPTAKQKVRPSLLELTRRRVAAHQCTM